MENQPVVVFDNFFSNGAALVAFAQTSTFEVARNLYPGIRAPLPVDYWSNAKTRTLQLAIAQGFALSGAINLIDASFSLVATPRERLSVGQRLPHPNAFNPRQIAFVHYLSHDLSEGTAVYRHRSTGLQSVTEYDRQSYFQHLDDELGSQETPTCEYICGSTDLFEQIHEVEGKFNRAILYRGQQWHSGAIRPSTPLSADPSRGRLTITAFMTVG